ncbi:hypothetical protein CHR62_09905 [Pusillimonas sp. NJUB218]|nr:hypothetical protein CHR62_09905 [Pusillimonas sp. NJUB218]
MLLGLNLFGLLIGGIMLASNYENPDLFMTIIMNMLWTVFNVLLAGACVAVSLESRQIRQSPRVSATLPAILQTPDGMAFRCDTHDFSEQGLGVTLPPGVQIAPGSLVGVTLTRGDDEAYVPCKVVLCQGQRIGVKLEPLTPEQAFNYTQMTFGRADLWVDAWNAAAPDAPLSALRNVLNIGVRGIRLFAKLSRDTLTEKLKHPGIGKARSSSDSQVKQP